MFLKHPYFFPCELTGGYNKQGCASNGGVDSIIAINLANILSYTLSPDGSEVTAMALVIGKQGYEITPDRAHIFANQDPVRNRANNSYAVPQTVMLDLPDDELDTQELTTTLGKGFFLFIVRYSNGKNRVFGLVNGMTLDTEANTSGQEYEDKNGSVLNFTGKELLKAPLVSNLIADALLEPAS